MNLLPDILAYIDPGSGLLIWQALAAGALGMVFYFKRFRDLIMLKIGLLFRSRPPTDESKPDKDS